MNRIQYILKSQAATLKNYGFLCIVLFNYSSNFLKPAEVRMRLSCARNLTERQVSLQKNMKNVIPGLSCVIPGVSRVIAALSRVIADLSRVIPGLSRVIPGLSRVIAALSRVIPGVSRVIAGLSRVILFVSSLIPRVRRFQPVGSTFHQKRFDDFNKNITLIQ